MEQLNSIGLDSSRAEILAGKLNDLLSNYSIFYQNVRGYHWNIKGDKFFELHVKFQDLYTDLQTKIDDIAERILTLGFSPEHIYSQYHIKSQIKESGKITDGQACVKEILQSLKVVIVKQREILTLASGADDEGTGAIMSDYIREQEKQVWMYSAFLAG